MYVARQHARGLARALRRRATKHETKIWRWLRGRRFLGLKFRRQYPIGRYVLDFYCEEIRLAIELDGRAHDSGADAVRSAALAARGITVFRIANSDIDRDETTVADRIIWAVTEALRRKSESAPTAPTGNEPSPAATPLPSPVAGRGR